MKKISIVVPTYNESGNVLPMSAAIKKIFDNELANYDYELLSLIHI